MPSTRSTRKRVSTVKSQNLVNNLDNSQTKKSKMSAKQEKTKPKREINKANTSSRGRGKKASRKNNIIPVDEIDPAEQMKQVADDERLFYGYERELAYLNQLVESLLRQNKANSVIVCGDAGFGKSSLVETCLNAFPVIRGEPDSEFGNLNVVLFEFDGNLHGKNDLSTLRLIGRRLNRLVEKKAMLDDDGDLNYDDDDDDDDDVDELNGDEPSADLSTKLANSVPKVIAQFRYLIERRSNFRCVIVLDNLEVFSYRQQYLLYNLFDLIQQGQAILIVGLTRRLDCVQLLTSRVQSRLNRRMIHLVAPFKSAESYSKFCESYCRLLKIDGTPIFDRIDQKCFRKEVEKAFAMNHSFDEVKRLVLQQSFVQATATASGTLATSEQRNVGDELKTTNSTTVLHHDPKIVDLTNLTRNELVLLIVATRQLRHVDTETFTCKQLHEWAIQVQQLKSLRFEHVIKCIYQMIELDLVIVAKESRSQSSKTAQLWITPWTSLMLNISEFQLSQLIEAIGSKMPAYIKQLFS